MWRCQQCQKYLSIFFKEASGTAQISGRWRVNVSTNDIKAVNRKNQRVEAAQLFTTTGSTGLTRSWLQLRLFCASCIRTTSTAKNFMGFLPTWPMLGEEIRSIWRGYRPGTEPVTSPRHMHNACNACIFVTRLSSESKWGGGSWVPKSPIVAVLRYWLFQVRSSSRTFGKLKMDRVIQIAYETEADMAQTAPKCPSGALSASLYFFTLRVE